VTFCNDCGKAVEWHKTAAGRDMPIDPEPTQAGRYYFDRRVRLVFHPPGAAPMAKMYTSHFDTCAKRKPAPAFSCEKCGVTTPHRHCYRCGAIGHMAADCPED